MRPSSLRSLRLAAATLGCVAGTWLLLAPTGHVSPSAPSSVAAQTAGASLPSLAAPLAATSTLGSLVGFVVGVALCLVGLGYTAYVIYRSHRPRQRRKEEAEATESPRHSKAA